MNLSTASVVVVAAAAAAAVEAVHVRPSVVAEEERDQVSVEAEAVHGRVSVAVVRDQGVVEEDWVPVICHHVPIQEALPASVLVVGHLREEEPSAHDPVVREPAAARI